MSRQLTITARARTDLLQTRLWYARIRLELAEDFTEDVDRTLAAVRERPGSFPEIHKGVRRALCDRYPYKIYFSHTTSEVRVLAVYHVSRKPRRWRKR